MRPGEPGHPREDLTLTLTLTRSSSRRSNPNPNPNQVILEKMDFPEPVSFSPSPNSPYPEAGPPPRLSPTLTRTSSEPWR